LVLFVAISENVLELIDEVLEDVVDVDLLNYQLGKLLDEALVDLLLKREHLVVGPVVLKEVFNP
jgi:hypothetical protein